MDSSDTRRSAIHLTPLSYVRMEEKPHRNRIGKTYQIKAPITIRYESSSFSVSVPSTASSIIGFFLIVASHQFRYELRASTDFVEGSWWMMKASLASPL